MTDLSAAEAELNPALLFLSAPIIHFRNNISSLKRLGVPQVTEDAQGSWCSALTATEFSWKRGVKKK